MKKLFSPREVGELLGVSEDTARRYMRAKMTCVRLPGNDLRVTEDEVERWTMSCREAPKEAPRKPRKPARSTIIDLNLFEADGRIKRRRKEA